MLMHINFSRKYVNSHEPRIVTFLSYRKHCFRIALIFPQFLLQVALLLVGNHAEEILKCDSFESIVEYMKTTIPEKVADETDDICTRALDMDIKQQLNLYEVEYQLLHEEMIDIRQSRERLEKQELAQKELVNKVKELESELTKANETIANLRTELMEANRHNDFLNTSCEREMLTLRLDSSGVERHISHNDCEEKVAQFVTSPDSINSINNDMTIPIDFLQHVNGVLTPSLDVLSTCNDEQLQRNLIDCVKSDFLTNENTAIDKDEKLQHDTL